MVRQSWQAGLGLIDKLFLGCLLIVFTLIFLHTPIIIVFGNLWPSEAIYIKAWKEALLLVALFSAIFIMWRDKKWNILDNWLVRLIIAYTLLGVIMTITLYQGSQATIAGLMIDYRYILAFGLFYIAGSLYPQLRQILLRIGAIGLAVVAIFGMLQVFVLPHDALKYIGYNKDVTIAPYQTVDENYDFVRINSTMRGPNTLGALMVIGLTVALSYGLTHWQKLVKNRRLLWILAFVSVAVLVSLWASYSRSAWGAAVVSGLVVVGLFYGKKLTKQHILIILASLGLLLCGLYVVKDTSFISNILLHEDPNEAGLINSNDGHAESLEKGSQLLLQQPLGAGVGSTGSASLLTDKSIIIENQYLFTAHELGWMGLALFMGIFGGIVYLLWRIWALQRDWLVLAIFAAGVGLMIIGFVLPVWVDDTVSIVWWALAGFIIGEYKIISGRKGGDK